jgi:hypothetical protein
MPSNIEDRSLLPHILKSLPAKYYSARCALNTSASFGELDSRQRNGEEPLRSTKN